MEDYKNSKNGQETARKYADIIHMERPDSEESRIKHPRMPLQNRAKIFSPFAALRGYDEKLAEEIEHAEYVTKRIMSDEEMEKLSNKLIQISRGMTITATYFEEDTAQLKDPPVGKYVTCSGKVGNIDPVFRTLRIEDTVIPFEDLLDLSGEGIVDIDEYLGISDE